MEHREYSAPARLLEKELLSATGEKAEQRARWKKTLRTTPYTGPSIAGPGAHTEIPLLWGKSETNRL